jgi:hypothetical protein
MMLLESWHSDLVQRLTQPQDPGTVALTGEPSSILVLATIVALPVSIALLWLYRRAVLKSMRTHVSSRTVEPLPLETSTSANQPAQRTPDLPILDHASPTTAGPEASVLYSSLLRVPWRAAAIYAAAGSCYALVMATASLMADNIELLPFRFLLNFWSYAWPVVLTVNLVAAATRRAKLATAAVYFFVFVALGALAKIPPLDQDQITIPWWSQIAVLWLVTNLPATGLLWVFLNRRIRAVGPLVLTFMILAFTGLKLPLDYVVVRQTTELGAYGVLIGLIVLGIALFGLVGWLTLRWIGARYERKKISDQSVTLDSTWLLFGFVQSIPLFFGGAVWILSGLVAFAVYKFVAWVGFSLLGPKPSPTDNSPQLLLLRVFSLGRRSARLFDALAKHWRHVGSIRLIAGPDLATTTIEPHEFLEFLTGKLARRFIDGPRTLDLRISEIDLQPDRDGRFRINDFFCYDDTWQMVLSRLEGDSDAVLMDLRSFSRENRGVIYEIEELINVVPLERVVFIVDETTDEEFLRQTVQACWERMKPSSPNQSPTLGQLRLFRFTGSHGGELKKLLHVLCNAIKPTAPIEESEAGSV